MTTGGSAANVVSTAVSLTSRRRHRCRHCRFDPCLMFRRLSSLAISSAAEGAEGAATGVAPGKQFLFLKGEYNNEEVNSCSWQHVQRQSDSRVSKM